MRDVELRDILTRYLLGTLNAFIKEFVAELSQVAQQSEGGGLTHGSTAADPIQLDIPEFPLRESAVEVNDTSNGGSAPMPDHASGATQAASDPSIESASAAEIPDPKDVLIDDLKGLVSRLEQRVHTLESAAKQQAEPDVQDQVSDLLEQYDSDLKATIAPRLDAIENDLKASSDVVPVEIRDVNHQPGWGVAAGITAVFMALVALAISLFAMFTP